MRSAGGTGVSPVPELGGCNGAWRLSTGETPVPPFFNELLPPLIHGCHLPRTLGNHLPQLRRLKHLGLEISEDREYSKGKGCPKCRGTGFFGRRALFEIFNITQEAKDMIVSKDFTENELKRLAVGQGMNTLLQAGRRAVDRGVTTVQEIIRVCGEG